MTSIVCRFKGNEAVFYLLSTTKEMKLRATLNIILEAMTTMMAAKTNILDLPRN